MIWVVLHWLAFALVFDLQSGRPALPDTPAAAPRQDVWKIIGPGGGGAQFLPTISPHNPRRVLVSCDMTGAYISQDAGDSWRMFNLRGTVRFFAFDPVDPETIYAATIGLWRSKDGGKSWSLVFPDPDSIERIEMPDDHAGARIVTGEGRSPVMTALAIDPGDSRTLYASVVEDGIPSLQVSSDGGVTWKREARLGLAARKILVEPRSPAGNRTLYVIGRNSVAVREEGRWSQGKPPSDSFAFADVTAGFPPRGGKPVIYGIAAAGGGAGNEIYVSPDGGTSWRRSFLVPEVPDIPQPRLSAVATCLNDPDVAYISYSRLYEDSSRREAFFGVAKTTDHGRSWKTVWKESSRTPAWNLQDAWITERFGPGWGENPLNLGVAPGNSHICYGTDYGRTMRTADGGKTWQAVYSKRYAKAAFTTTGLDVTTNYGVHFDPFDRQRIFVSYTDIGLFRSDDGGVAWVSSSLGAPQRWVNTTYWIEFDPAVKGRIWAAMSGTHDLPRPKMWRRTSPRTYEGGVCISEDGGISWKASGTNLPQIAATHIMLDPKSPPVSRILYVTGFGKGVFKSLDGGRTWTLKNQGLEQKEPFAWRLARDNRGFLYLVIARRSEDGSYGNESDGALYRSTDEAGHWERVQLPKGVNGPNGISVDPKDPARLYLAAWGRNAGNEAADGGVFISIDGGVSWRNVLSGDQHIYDVAIDPRDPNVLCACGFESSAWRSADRGESWKRIRGYNFKWGHRVIPDPYHTDMIYITTFGGSVWYGPAAGDGRALEDIMTRRLAYTP